MADHQNGNMRRAIMAISSHPATRSIIVSLYPTRLFQKIFIRPLQHLISSGKNTLDKVCNRVTQYRAEQLNILGFEKLPFKEHNEDAGLHITSVMAMLGILKDLVGSTKRHHTLELNVKTALSSAKYKTKSKLDLVWIVMTTFVKSIFDIFNDPISFTIRQLDSHFHRMAFGELAFPNPGDPFGNPDDNAEFEAWEEYWQDYDAARQKYTYTLYNALNDPDFQWREDEGYFDNTQWRHYPSSLPLSVICPERRYPTRHQPYRLCGPHSIDQNFERFVKARAKRLTLIARAKVNSMPFLFFRVKLPLEIRNEIYSNILKYSQDSRLTLYIKSDYPAWHFNDDYEETFQYPIPDSASALLSAHAQLRREFLENAAYCNRASHNTKTCTKTSHLKRQLYKKLKRVVFEFTVPLRIYGKDSAWNRDMLVAGSRSSRSFPCFDLMEEEENMDELECKVTFLDQLENPTEVTFSHTMGFDGWIHKVEKLRQTRYEISNLKGKILEYFDQEKIGELLFDLDL